MKPFLKKTPLLVILISFCACVAQQKYISNEYQKGYLKEGHKVSFWEYYDYKGNLELKMNYENGQVLYLKPDTSEYVIKKNGEWVSQKLKVYPKNIGSSFFLYKDIGVSINYPANASKNLIEGYVYISFEIDSTGAPGNFTIEKDIGGGCGQEALRTVKEAALRDGNWIPAQIDGKTYNAKFIMPITFSLRPTKLEDLSPTEAEDLPLAKHLLAIHVEGYSSKK